MSLDAVKKFSAATQILPEPDNEQAPLSPARLAKTEQRRKQVLDAARTVFRRHGFHGASMAEIAAEAEMSVGHIYRYFENKEAVIVAIVDQDLQLAKETIDRMLDDPAGVTAALLAGVDEGVGKMLDREDAALFMEVMAEAARNPKVAQSARLQHEAAQACLGWLFQDDGTADGAFTPAQAIDLMSLVFSGLRVRAIQDPTADVSVLAPTVRALVMQLSTQKKSG